MIFTRDYDKIRKELMRKAINDRMIITSRDVALRMYVRSGPVFPITVVNPHEWLTSGTIYTRITRAMEWLYDADIAFKKGKEPLISMEQYINHDNKLDFSVSDNLTISVDSASIVGVDSSNVASSTGYSFTLNNPTITKDILDKLTTKTNDIVATWKTNCDDAEDVINRELFTFKKLNTQEAPIRPLRYWQTDNGCLTVEWTDHTKTTVTPSDPEHADVFSGICIAYTKKMFGSTTAIMRSIEQAKWLTDMPKRRKEMTRKYIKENRERQHKREAERHEQAIQRRVENIKIEQEAQKRIAEEKEASNNA